MHYIEFIYVYYRHPQEKKITQAFPGCILMLLFRAQGMQTGNKYYIYVCTKAVTMLLFIILL